MNSIILMAEITQDPQLRYTPDNQTPLAEMTVQFAGLRDDDPPATLKAVGWGNLAQDIQSRFHTGDRVILEGRLNMNSVDRPEGFKEKRAELTIQKIHLLNNEGNITATAASQPAAQTEAASMPPANGAAKAKPSSSRPAPASRSAEPARTPAYSAPAADPQDYDDIPF